MYKRTPFAPRPPRLAESTVRPWLSAKKNVLLYVTGNTVSTKGMCSFKNFFHFFRKNYVYSTDLSKFVLKTSEIFKAYNNRLLPWTNKLWNTDQNRTKFCIKKRCSSSYTNFTRLKSSFRDISYWQNNSKCAYIFKSS